MPVSRLRPHVRLRHPMPFFFGFPPGHSHLMQPGRLGDSLCSSQRVYWQQPRFHALSNQLDFADVVQRLGDGVHTCTCGKCRCGGVVAESILSVEAGQVERYGVGQNDMPCRSRARICARRTG